MVSTEPNRFTAAIESTVFEEAAKPKHQVQWFSCRKPSNGLLTSHGTTTPLMTGRRLKDSTLMTYIETARHIRVVGMVDEPLLAIDLEWYYDPSPDLKMEEKTKSR